MYIIESNRSTTERIHDLTGIQKMNMNIASEAARKMAALPYEQQEKTLEFMKGLTLSGKSGVLGEKLLKYAGFIPSDDLKAMSQAIESDCGKTEANEW